MFFSNPWLFLSELLLLSGLWLIIVELSSDFKDEQLLKDILHYKTLFEESREKDTSKPQR